MNAILRSIWRDESAAVVALEIVLLWTVLIIGSLAGLTAIRDAVIVQYVQIGERISRLSEEFGIESTRALRDSVNSSMDGPAACLVVCDGSFIFQPKGFSDARAIEETEPSDLH